MKLTDMKITAEEQEQRDKDNRGSSPMAISDKPYYRDRYPYGLEIRLDEETIEKLGLETLPKVGKKIRVEAVAFVSGASVNEQTETKDGTKARTNRSLTIQIRKLAISPDPQSAEDAIDDALEDVVD